MVFSLRHRLARNVCTKSQLRLPGVSPTSARGLSGPGAHGRLQPPGWTLSARRAGRCLWSGSQLSSAGA